MFQNMLILFKVISFLFCLELVEGFFNNTVRFEGKFGDSNLQLGVKGLWEVESIRRRVVLVDDLVGGSYQDRQGDGFSDRFYNRFGIGQQYLVRREVKRQQQKGFRVAWWLGRRGRGKYIGKYFCADEGDVKWYSSLQSSFIMFIQG